MRMAATKRSAETTIMAHAPATGCTWSPFPSKESTMHSTNACRQAGAHVGSPHTASVDANRARLGSTTTPFVVDALFDIPTALDLQDDPGADSGVQHHHDHGHQRHARAEHRGHGQAQGTCHRRICATADHAASHHGGEDARRKGDRGKQTAGPPDPAPLLFALLSSASKTSRQSFPSAAGSATRYAAPASQAGPEGDPAP